jgi:hypothetical protein
MKAHQRQTALAFPHPNWCLPKDGVHTSYLPGWSTPFLHRLFGRTSASPSASIAPSCRASSGEHPTNVTTKIDVPPNPPPHRRSPPVAGLPVATNARPRMPRESPVFSMGCQPSSKWGGQMCLDMNNVPYPFPMLYLDSISKGSELVNFIEI